MISFDLGRSDPSIAHPADLPAQQWIPAVVPGGVHESLIAAGEIEHPFRDVSGSAWVASTAWWYRAQLPHDARPSGRDRALLRLDGVDTVADVFIGNHHVAHHENQFRPLVVDVTDHLGTGALYIRFGHPLTGLSVPPTTQRGVDALRAVMGIAPDSNEPPAGVAANPALTRRRKATFSWGWDFAPPATSIGLIGPALLEMVEATRLIDVHWRTTELALDRSRATIELTVTALVAEGDDVAVSYDLVDDAGAEVAMGAVRLDDRDGESATGITAIQLDMPRLWWTHDLGAPHTYRLRISLCRNDDGFIVDTREARVGVRTIELDRSPDPVAGGRRFTFRLNGVEIFARGANWVPPSMLIGSVSDANYSDLLSRARDANMTMIRVWGGGVYERDSFYDECDRLGVLVWQDFMFACADYPDDDPDLMAEITAEAEHQVRRLRNHPSLALWCGNNEAYALHVAFWGVDDDSEGWGRRIWDEALPDAVVRLCPDVPYWPGSPFGTDDPRGPNGVGDGDRHAWEVWHGANLGVDGPTEFATPGAQTHFARYAHDTGKFISEFGIQSSAAGATLERWTATTPATVAELLAARNMDTPKDKGLALLEVETGLPDTPARYIAMSMAVQAEGMKFAIEHYRRRQPHTSGTLIWQLDEPWPGITWSLIDHDGVPKAAYHAVARAYSPVIASFVESAGLVELWVTNSTDRAFSDTLTVQIRAFDGTAAPLDERVAVAMGPGESSCVWASAAPDADDRGLLYAWVTSLDRNVPANRLFFAPLRELPLGGHVVSTVLERTESGIVLAIDSVDEFAYGVHIPLPHSTVRASDDYFDLPAGERRIVTLTGLDTDDVTAVVARTYADDLGDVGHR